MPSPDKTRFSLLAFDLLGIDYLPVPKMNWHIPEGHDGHDDPHLTDHDYQTLCNIICECLPSVTVQDWRTSSVGERVALMEAALKMRREREEVRWTAGTFLAKANELKRRLLSWHIEDWRFPCQFVSERGSRERVRRTFRHIVVAASANHQPRSSKGWQMYPFEVPDKDGYVGEFFENPDCDTDQSFTMWLLADFQIHLNAGPAFPALDYLKHTFDQFLEVPAWAVRSRREGEPWSTHFSPDEYGEERTLKVTGRTVPETYLTNLCDAAAKLMTAAPAGWITQANGTGPKVDSSGNLDKASGTAAGHQQPNVASRTKLFISYIHKDEKYLKELQTHLKPLERSELIEAWSDKEINPGSDWFVKIKEAMESAQLALLLVSGDFLASEFIHQHELTPLLDQAKAGTLRILWVPVTASNYKFTPLRSIQAAVDPGKPLAERGKFRNKAWVEICERIRKELGWTDK
jgi:hypothetical protein